MTSHNETSAPPPAASVAFGPLAQACEPNTKPPIHSKPEHNPVDNIRSESNTATAPQGIPSAHPSPPPPHPSLPTLHRPGEADLHGQDAWQRTSTVLAGEMAGMEQTRESLRQMVKLLSPLSCHTALLLIDAGNRFRFHPPKDDVAAWLQAETDALTETRRQMERSAPAGYIDKEIGESIDLIHALAHGCARARILANSLDAMQAESVDRKPAASPTPSPPEPAALPDRKSVV